jgi:hypothetical protein
VWFTGEKKGDALYLKESQLRQDGLGEHIDEYEKIRI